MLLKRLVILVGLRNSGKTTFADSLEAKGYKPFAIAQPLVDLAQDIFGFDDYEKFKTSKVVGDLTGRDFICKVGDYTHEISEEGLVYNTLSRIGDEDNAAYVVITDVRTESELICSYLTYANADADTEIVVVHLVREGIEPPNMKNTVHRTERLASTWHNKPINEIYVPYDNDSRVKFVRCNSRDSAAIDSLTRDMS